MAPNAIAPSASSEPVLPMTAVSDNPSRGTDALASITGQARCRILRRFTETGLIWLLLIARFGGQATFFRFLGFGTGMLDHHQNFVNVGVFGAAFKLSGQGHTGA